MTAAKDLVGFVSGRLTVVRRAGSRRSKALWACTCSCGGELEATTDRLTRGVAKSCGCLYAETRTARLAHGGTIGGKRSKEFRTWIQIRRRTIGDMRGKIPCYRDVSLADEWADDFAAFRQHIGPAPSEAHTIDRIDPNRGYEPGNVRWATMKEQNRNRRRHRYVQYNGQRMVLSHACELAGLDYYATHAAIARGKNPFEALY